VALYFLCNTVHYTTVNLFFKESTNYLLNLNNIHSELSLIKNILFNTCNIELTNVVTELESQEYFAQKCKLNEKNITFRTAKITPTKTGFFVTIWKRNQQGTIEPFNIIDDIDLFIISARKDENFGIFIFPKRILHVNKIISSKLQKGKLGIRVYPTWSKANSKQAQKTQHWQTSYFLDISNENEINIEKAKNLLNLS
jgi:hypothetical protein